MVEKKGRITFYGVRGSIPTPGLGTAGFGGNTSCVELELGDRIIILDAGSGIRLLGDHLMDKHKTISADLFITHTHWDHIQGFPFFAPGFMEGNRFVIYGPGRPEVSFEELMKGQMHPNYFPIQIDNMKATIKFVQIKEKQSLQLQPNIKVLTAATNHPGGCLAYRIEWEGISICYMTDTEHSPEIFEEQAAFIQEADIVIYDANYTDVEYEGHLEGRSKKGWGHSTWTEGIRLCKAAKAKKLILFHHDSHRTDEDMEAIEKEAQSVYRNTVAAREGLVIEL